jgi:hypothetical protein
LEQNMVFILDGIRRVIENPANGLLFCHGDDE